MIGFITLRFEWFWIPICLTLLGIPLLVLLSALRAWVEKGQARRTALAAIAAALLAGGALVLFVAEESFIFSGLIPLLCVLLLGAAWIWMLLRTRFWRFWADALVLAIPTGLALWLWHIE